MSKKTGYGSNLTVYLDDPADKDIHPVGVTVSFDDQQLSAKQGNLDVSIRLIEGSPCVYVGDKMVATLTGGVVKVTPSEPMESTTAYLCRTYQIERLETFPNPREDNSIYRFSAVAHIPIPKYMKEYPANQKQEYWRVDGSGDSLDAAINNLREKLQRDPSLYRRDAPHYQIQPYRRHVYGDPARCDYCGHLLNEQTHFCTRTGCPYETKHQYA